MTGALTNIDVTTRDFGTSSDDTIVKGMTSTATPGNLEQGTSYTDDKLCVVHAYSHDILIRFLLIASKVNVIRYWANHLVGSDQYFFGIGELDRLWLRK
jgi:hypothetical protein